MQSIDDILFPDGSTDDSLEGLFNEHGQRVVEMIESLRVAMEDLYACSSEKNELLAHPHEQMIYLQQLLRTAEHIPNMDRVALSIIRKELESYKEKNRR